MAADLKHLIMQRGQLKSWFAKFMQEVRGKEDVNQVKIRKAKIEDIWSEFEKVQSSIEVEGNMSEQESYRIEFEETYFQTIAEAENCIQSSEKEEAKNERNEFTGYTRDTIRDNEQISSLPKNKAPVKLAALNIPTFSGNYEEWSAFYDIFTALIDKNPVLLSIEKFFYLRNALSGEALNCVSCLETTAKNYEIAWKTLVDRFNNRKIVIQTHVKSIVESDMISNELSGKLRLFVDKLNGHMQALETLGQSPNLWDPLHTHIILTKLDKNTVRKWEIGVISDKVATSQQVNEFLDKRAKMQESIKISK
jgi:hypothetical protein